MHRTSEVVEDKLIAEKIKESAQEKYQQEYSIYKRQLIDTVVEKFSNLDYKEKLIKLSYNDLGIINIDTAILILKKNGFVVKKNYLDIFMFYYKKYHMTFVTAPIVWIAFFVQFSFGNIHTLMYSLLIQLTILIFQLMSVYKKDKISLKPLSISLKD
jgi:hypothetical protein